MTEEDITPLLREAHEGNREALNEVARRVHGDLMRMANKMMRGRYGGRRLTLEPTSLVNETFVKLLQQRNEYKNREHFFAIATKAMLRALLDYHKARARAKRGPDQVRVSLSGVERRGAVEAATEVPELVEALERLEVLDARAARVFKLRALWGMNGQEVADVLGVSRSTIDRDWRFARAWLRSNLT